MIFRHAAVPPFMKNGFVLGCEETREGVIIDPGDEVDELIDAARAERLSIQYILLTHAHVDHITGVGRAKAAFGAPIGLHPDDRVLYAGAVEQARMFGLDVDPQPPVDFFYGNEGPWRFGRYEVFVRHTPGHCPGGVCLTVQPPGDVRPTLIVGDTLFAGSIGRTDMPGGDYQTLIHSIRTVLFAYDDACVVWPGHGESTTIGRERRTNPFLTT